MTQGSRGFMNEPLCKKNDDKSRRIISLISLWTKLLGILMLTRADKILIKEQCGFSRKIECIGFD